MNLKRIVLPSILFASAAVTSVAAPLDKFVDPAPATQPPAAQEYALSDTITLAAKLADIAGGLKLVALSMERELLPEFRTASKANILTTVENVSATNQSFSFTSNVDGANFFVIDGSIDSPSATTTRIRTRVRVCMDSSYKVFKSMDEITGTEKRAAKLWQDTLRGFYGDADKLKKLTTTYEKLERPATASQLYEATAIIRKQPVLYMTYDEVVKVFGEPTWSDLNASAWGNIYYAKSETSALAVTFGDRRVVKEPMMVTVDGNIRALKKE